jgi:hypothetical protein
MIISDLQHIESATETEVNGGFAAGGCYQPSYPSHCGGSYYPRPYNVASAEAGAQAFGSNTRTSTSTDTLVIQGQFSGSRSSSFAEAS